MGGSSFATGAARKPQRRLRWPATGRQLVVGVYSLRNVAVAGLPQTLRCTGEPRARVG